MTLKHKVNVYVTTPVGVKQSVIKTGICTIPHRILTALLGEGTQVLVLKPGQTVKSVEIHEVKEGEKNYEQNQIITQSN